MKRKELDETKQKPTIELEKELRAKQTKLVQLKFDLATGKVKNLREIYDTKKTIAQLKTMLRSRVSE